MSVGVRLFQPLTVRGNLLAPFAVFIALRAALCLIPLDPVSDAAWYFNRASAIAAGAGYSEGGVPTAFWPPGWPFVLGGLFKVFGASVGVVQCFNLACACIGAWFTYDLGRRLFASERAGRAALWIVALYPNHAGYVPQALTEVMYTTLTLGGCWLLIVRPWRATLPVAGLVFGFATLVKAQSLVLVPLIFAITAVRDGGGWRALPRQAGRAAIVLVIAFATVFPWTLRNHAVFGEWVLVSTNGGFTLLTGNNPSATGDYTPDDPLVVSVVRTVATQVSADREYKRRAVEWMAAHPGDVIRLMPLKLWRLWAPDGEAEWAFQAGFRSYDAYRAWFRTVRWVNQAYYACMMAGFAGAGWWLASGRVRIGGERIGWWLLPFGIALYPSLIAIVFSGQSRFHYPVMPFIAMACGWLLTAQPWMSTAQSGTPRAAIARRNSSP